MEQQSNELYVIVCPYVFRKIIVETTGGELAAINAFASYIDDHRDSFPDLISAIGTVKKITMKLLRDMRPTGCNAFRVQSREITSEWIRKVHGIRDIENVWLVRGNIRMMRFKIKTTDTVIILNENGEMV